MPSALSQWLHSVGLERLEPVLAEHGIAEDVLTCLTERDLEQLGLSMGDRKRLLKAMAMLPPQAPDARPRGSGLGDMRQLTIMFCDLVDSTALSRRLGPEQWHDVVLAYQQAAGTVIERWGGAIAQYLGDGLLVYFGHPQAHEDAPERALRAGLELVSAVRDLQGPVLDELPQRLSVRIGIHTGQVMIGDIGAGVRREQLALGEAPNIAARLQHLAAPDTVLVSDATRRLAGAHFVVDDLGRHELKGVHEARQVWRVSAVAQAGSRFDAVLRTGLAPLVGRGQELGLLNDRWELARQGRGQVVVVSGEPGIGKSRLLKELRNRLGNAGLEGVQMQCSPYHVHGAFHPVVEHLERVLRFTCDMPPDMRRDRLDALVCSRAGLGDRQAALIAAMMGLPVDRAMPLAGSARERERDTVLALVELLAATAGAHAGVVLLEDAHWADPATLSLLDSLIEHAESRPLLLVVTHRPEFEPPGLGADHVTHLPLSGLRRAEVAALVDRLAGEQALSPEVAEQVMSRTDGVPLFVEELTRTLLESAQALGAGSPHGDAAVPVTLRDSLMARLDRLDVAKEVAQVGAVLGREFGHAQLESLMDWPPSRLAGAVGALTRSGLVSRQLAHDGPRYLFKHALVQDAAYDSLPPSRRRDLHGAVVDMLQARFPAQAHAQPETLARHASAAGRCREAVVHWRRAGELALQRLALREAVAHLKAAITDAGRLPQLIERQQIEVQLHASLGTVHMLGQGWASPDVAQAYARAHELSSAMDQVEEAVWPLWGVCIFHLVHGQINEALGIGERVLTLARQAGSRQVWLVANMLHTQLCLYSGRLGEVQGHVEQVEHRYHDPQDRNLIALYSTDLKLVAMVHGSQARWMRGLDHDAQALCDAQERYATTLDHPYSMAWVLTWGAMSYLHRGEAQALLDRVREGLRLAQQHGFAYVTGMGTFAQGWAQARLGALDEGIAGMQAGLAAFQATGAGIAVPFFQTLLAEVLGQAGRADEGLRLLDEAGRRMARGGERWHEAEWHRIRAVLLAAGSAPDPVGVRQAIDEALATGRAQGAGAWVRKAESTRQALGLT